MSSSAKEKTRSAIGGTENAQKEGNSEDNMDSSPAASNGKEWMSEIECTEARRMVF